MDTRDVTVRAPPKGSAGMDHSEEMVAEVDEPPDERQQHTYRTSHFWSPPKFHNPQYTRRESLLTRQLHSETEHTDDEHHQPSRALSTQSTFSNPSTTSTAELTSDDGHSVASPAISPPLGPTHVTTTLPIHEKPLDQRVKIVGHEGIPPRSVKGVGSEKTLEANLGRKRCISFACRGKPQEKPETKEEPVKSPEAQTKEPSPPPKRKSMIKFACPTRAESSEKAAEKPIKRPASPAPLRRPSADAKAQAFRSHRGSDSTVTHPSPKSSRKPSVSRSSSTRDDSQRRRPSTMRKLSNDSDSEGHEATRFHEFGTSEEEPEDWTRESTCHRSRLTLDDVLKKENVIRQACEEADEEVVEEEEEEEEEEEAEEEDEQADEMAEVDKDENDDLDEEDEGSDEGFHSDDEEGFASSDDDDNDSDYEWWKPGASTAATSVEHLDRLAIVNSKPVEQSSIGSASSGRESIRSLRHRLHKRHTKTSAINISNRPPTPDLPDSTDFVCGTLDEDRPLEQAYINRKKMKEAAKHRSRPQDIDPSFPTSDPEMDEEDDDDVDEVARSEGGDEEEHDLMHGGLDEIHGAAPLGRTTSNRNRGRSNSHRSPPPAKHSSPPPSKRRSVARSPLPPTKRGNARSPPPRKLFGHSPKRMRSPAPPLGKRMMTSPPNSPTQGTSPLSTAPHLAERPRLQHTASLPRPTGFMLSRLATIHQDRRASSTSANNANNNGNDSDGAATAVEIPKRGAIDIVKGLEKKRRLRKEKMYQKLCAKQAAKGEKVYKVKPGKGCERMREVGLGVQEYRGQRAEHILSL